MLLFDANLSPRLTRELASAFVGCEHVFDVGGIAHDDGLIWRHARDRGLTIVTKDSDFEVMASCHGPPPKVVLLAIGNGPTRDVVELLAREFSLVEAFIADPASALLVLR